MKRCPSCQSSLPSDYTHCPRDGSTLVAVAEWVEGSLIRGKYCILAKVGEGGMASVYKALHTRFNEMRALKVISAELASDANFVRRFEQEAIVTRKLQHSNAVRVDDIDEAEDGRPFIVMEFVEGRSLKEVIEQEAPMSLPRVSAIVQQAAAALDAAHSVGLIHRDIKPGNIALAWTADASGDRLEQVKVLDFGIAKLREARLDSKTRSAHLTLTDTGMMIGTPAYMSPEQAKGMKGDQLDGRSDIYSLGVVMYQMLSGDLPLKADSTLEQLMAHLNAPPRPIREVRPDLPSEFAAVVMRCLEKNRDLRPASGAALISELQWAASRPQSSPAERPPAPLPKPKEQAAPSSAFEKTTPSIPVKALAEETAELAEEAPKPLQRRKRSLALLWIAVAVVAIALMAGIALFRPGQRTGSSTTVQPTTAVTTNSNPLTTDQKNEIPIPPAVSREVVSANTAPAAREPVKPATGVSSSHRIAQPPAASLPAANAVTKPAVTAAPSTSRTPDHGVPLPSTPAIAVPQPFTQPASTGSPPAASAPNTPAPATQPVAVYRVGGGVSAPSIVSAPQPDYTDEASRAHKEGNVVLSIIVDTSGRARNVKVVGPLGYGLDEKAIQAVQQWRFQPGMKDGKPVNVQINIEVEFRQY